MADVEHSTEIGAAPETPPTRRPGPESESGPKKASSQSVRGLAHTCGARRAGKAGARRGAALQPRGVGAGRRSARSGRPARRAGRDPPARAPPGPVRPDARVPVHVLPGRRLRHGRRSSRFTPHGSANAAVRRRASVQLRRIRGTGPPACLRPERLRRDLARPIRVGRQAPRRELCGRGAETAASTRRSVAPSTSRSFVPTVRRWPLSPE